MFDTEEIIRQLTDKLWPDRQFVLRVWINAHKERRGNTSWMLPPSN